MAPFWSTGKKSLDAGISKGLKAGHLSVWVLMDKSQPIEVYRVRVTCTSADYRGQVPPFTFTFAPAYEKSFVRSLETPFEFREFLVGTHRAKTGRCTFELITSHGPQVLNYEIADILKLFRLKGKDAPSSVSHSDRFSLVDSPELAKLADSELKAYSEKIKAELEAKRLQEEEERKKKEAEKAAAAKAAADKAAAAAAKPSKGGTAPVAGAAPAGPQPPTLSPAKVGIFYGTSTGNTEDVANQIKNALGDVVEHVKNVTEIVAADLTVCEVLILGVPTWHIGEMQDDWAKILPELDALNFNGKKLAIFGLGDQKGYPDTYVDAMGELLEKFEKTGAKLYGLWPTEGYKFTASKGLRDNKFMGLVIDIENQANQTEARVKAWVKQIKGEIGI